jgi:hypothetical protein
MRMKYSHFVFKIEYHSAVQLFTPTPISSFNTGLPLILEVIRLVVYSSNVY